MSMNHITVYSAHDLDLIFNQPFLLTGNTHKNDQETEHNMWAISCASTKKSGITKDTFMKFISALQKVIRKQLQNSHNKFQATLYVWFDEMAGQLRFNVVSGKVINLPFGCTVTKVTSPESIIESFLSSPYLHGIPDNEIEDIPLDDNHENDDDNEYVLPVYVSYINSTHN